MERFTGELQFILGGNEGWLTKNAGRGQNRVLIIKHALGRADPPREGSNTAYLTIG